MKKAVIHFKMDCVFKPDLQSAYLKAVDSSVAWRRSTKNLVSNRLCESFKDFKNLNQASINSLKNINPLARAYFGCIGFALELTK